jgi:hypothetical protein
MNRPKVPVNLIRLISLTFYDVVLWGSGQAEAYIGRNRGVREGGGSLVGSLDPGKFMPSPGWRRLGLIGSLAMDDRRQGLGQNLEIEPQGPAVDIVHIHLHPFLKGEG